MQRGGALPCNRRRRQHLQRLGRRWPAAGSASQLARPGLKVACRWEDGQLVQKRLTEPNRWEVHSAEEVAVTLGDLRLRILQQASALRYAAACIGWAVGCMGGS